MKKSDRLGYRGNSWKILSELIGSGKYSRDKIFNDWLDLILASALALRDNIQRKGIKIDLSKMDGVYEDRYMEIVESYDNSGEKGKRPVDYFARAYVSLMKEIKETDKDCLGDIFMSEITFGEHGQFFTPEHITDMMALMTVPSESEEGRQVVCDPCCGSGRMLMSAHKNNPEAFLVGIDLDVSVIFWPPCLGSGEGSSSTCGGCMATKGLGWKLDSRWGKVLPGVGGTGQRRRSGGSWS